MSYLPLVFLKARIGFEPMYFINIIKDLQSYA